jgi:hypothetical protein
MVLGLPGIVLSLGRNLEAPVPPMLTVTHPTLDALIAEHDPCAPGTSECGARDWTDLRQRMHYILHLFRAYAVDRAILTPPFTTAQLERFRRGEVPEGEL